MKLIQRGVELYSGAYRTLFLVSGTMAETGGDIISGIPTFAGNSAELAGQMVSNVPGYAGTMARLSGELIDGIPGYAESLVNFVVDGSSELAQASGSIIESVPGVAHYVADYTKESVSEAGKWWSNVPGYLWGLITNSSVEEFPEDNVVYVYTDAPDFTPSFLAPHLTEQYEENFGVYRRYKQNIYRRMYPDCAALDITDTPPTSQEVSAALDVWTDAGQLWDSKITVGIIPGLPIFRQPGNAASSYQDEICLYAISQQVWFNDPLYPYNYIPFGRCHDYPDLGWYAILGKGCLLGAPLTGIGGFAYRSYYEVSAFRIINYRSPFRVRPRGVKQLLPYIIQSGLVPVGPAVLTDSSYIALQTGNNEVLFL